MPQTENNANDLKPKAPEESSVLFFMAETPVHAGAGGGKAALDLPIQRSVQTDWPILNDSTVRGGLRRLVRSETDAKKWFGNTEAAGYFSTPDAELILFPVASAEGLTAWVTCREALWYFHRKVSMFQPSLDEKASQALADFGKRLRAMGRGPDLGKAWAASSAVQIGGSVVLEADRFEIDDVEKNKRARSLAEWIGKYGVPLQDAYWADRVCDHFVLIHEKAFTHYVQRKTDIRTRIKVEEGKVHKTTGPWTEENLPVDTLLYAVLHAPEAEGEPELAKFRGAKGVRLADRPVVQLGGDQNLGRGMMRLRVLGE